MASVIDKVFGGKRSSFATLCLFYGLALAGFAKWGLANEVVSSLLTFGGVVAGAYLGGQSLSDTVNGKSKNGPG